MNGRNIGLQMRRRTIRRRKQLVFAAVIVIASIVFAMRVSGQDSQEKNTETAEAFRLVAPGVVRDAMEEKLYSDCGVMVTAVFENGVVEGFRVTVRNERLALLTPISKQVLEADLAKRLQDTWMLCKAQGAEGELEVTTPAISVILNGAEE